jgi:hypothetical protein
MSAGSPSSLPRFDENGRQHRNLIGQDGLHPRLCLTDLPWVFVGGLNRPGAETGDFDVGAQPAAAPRFCA